jgi:heptosyltransferase III
MNILFMNSARTWGGTEANLPRFTRFFLLHTRALGQRKKPITIFDGELKSIVILARECYGDAIMQTPLIATLREEYPGISIYIVAFTRIIFDFFSADTNVTAVYLAKRDLKRYFFEFLPKKFDVLFNPKNHPSTNFYIQSLIIRAKYKVGHRNTKHEALYDYLIDLKPGTHESTSNLALMDAINNRPQHPCRPYVPQMPVSNEIAFFLETLPSASYTGINISAGHIKRQRTIDQWSEFIRNVPDETFIILSSPGDLEKKKILEQHTNTLESPSTRNIFEVGEIVKKLKLLITPDTSLVHIASCYDTPIIALYSNILINRRQFAPLSVRQMVIVSKTTDIIDIENEIITSALHSMHKKLHAGVE